MDGEKIRKEEMMDGKMIGKEGKIDQLDITSTNFNCEMYLSDLFRKKNLDELVQVEEDMIHNVRRLDSEMQQLVYENYNKFLTATSTVKKMQNDFMEMGHKMENLSERMSKIATLSKDLSTAFSKHRANVSQLSDANKKVKSLQFLLSLPQKLQALIEQKNYEEAVKIYSKARPSLLRCKDLSSISDIYSETITIMGVVEEQLKQVICSCFISSDKLSEAINLLLMLNVDPSTVYADFLASCRRNLSDQLIAMRAMKRDDTDVLEFVDNCCSTFLTDLSLVKAINQRFFPNQVAVVGDVIELMDSLMNQFEEVVRMRFLEETDAAECAVVVRALDRFYRRMSSCNQLIRGMDYLPLCISMLNIVSRHEIELAQSRVVERVSSALQQIQEELASQEACFSNVSLLNEVISRLEHSLLVQIKTALASLLLFTASDMTFSSLDQAQFSLGFGIDVHELLVVKSLDEVAQLGLKYCDITNQATPLTPVIYVVLAQFFINIENNSVIYIMDLCQEQFRLVAERERGDKSRLSSVEKVRVRLRTVAYELLKYYVYVQGIMTSEVLIRSIESRDWLSCAEPTAVRAAVKHFIEDLATIDSAIKPFMDEGTRKERLLEGVSSRSYSRRTFDSCSLSSTLDKLWSERVDLYTNVEFNRVSILTAIVNIALKSLLECVRLQTFSRFGLQQIQVDCCFLRQNLWRYLSDEQIALSLIDEIVSSAVHRSIDPKLMEPITVKAVCGR
uniref:Vacuolar protein sorting-associated protein 51 homolog n=1 Tax=Setaria digitata TaxID=48799 RepID=A0A915Q0E7_9BILA